MKALPPRRAPRPEQNRDARRGRRAPKTFFLGHFLPTDAPLKATEEMDFAERLKPFGSTAGAMHVEVRGVRKGGGGSAAVSTFFLCADNGAGNPTLENTPGAIAGPEIPVTPAVVLVAKLAREGISALGGAGARPCVSLLTVDEAMASMEGMRVWTEVHDDGVRRRA